MKWYFEGPVDVKNPETKKYVTFYIDASGDISKDDFDVTDLTISNENGERFKEEGWEEDAIEEALFNNDSLYEQALDRSFNKYDRREDLE